jgi:Lon protease-like protein
VDGLTPIFPLELVVYPGNNLNLHIFEPRYKQLINDCADTKMPFGIPAVVNRSVGEFGTLVELLEIVNVQPTGEMDIRTRGLKVF